MITESIVKTPYGKSYMKRLCRHFAHKIPAATEGNQGTIEFPFGICHINVSDQEMRFRVEVSNPEDLDRAESVVGDHLVRMANRDEPVVVWERTNLP